MSIHGMNGAGGTIGPGPIRANQVHDTTEVANGADRGHDGQLTQAGDRVEISAVARALSAADVAQTDGVAPTAPSGDLTAERLQAVLTRLQVGYYDSPQVQETTAQNLLPDLRTLPND